MGRRNEEFGESDSKPSSSIRFTGVTKQVGDDFGIDWNGPIHGETDSTVVVDELNCPLDEEQLHSLTEELLQFTTDNSEDSWRMQYIEHCVMT